MQIFCERAAVEGSGDGAFQNTGRKLGMMTMRLSTTTTGGLALFFLLAAGNAFGQEICSDAYMTAQIQPYADRAQNAGGICPTAKAGVALYKASIELVNPCLDDPNLAAYKVQLEQLLRDAENTRDSSCG